MDASTTEALAQAIFDLNPEWRSRAECAKRRIDVNLFFSGRDARATQLFIRRICADCEVRVECIADALVCGDRLGIRGGVGAKTRLALKRDPKIASALQALPEWQKHWIRTAALSSKTDTSEV